MDEKNIVDMISRDYSWEQIIYQIVAWEGMDPWNVNLVTLSDSFLKFIEKAKQLDFRLPAKYIIISSVLLRMKSDHLDFLDIIHGGEIVLQENGHAENGEVVRFEVNPITMPMMRQPKKRVGVSDLVEALGKALKTDERRNIRDMKARKQIVINQQDISKRIEQLYSRIEGLIRKMDKDEIMFSNLITKGDRKDFVDVFLPLVYLDHHKRVECRQEEPFNEIFIKKR